MKNIKNTCIDFFKNEDTKRDVKEIVTPLFQMLYNEVYPYIWLICIYHVFFIGIILAILIILLKLLYNPRFSSNISKNI